MSGDITISDLDILGGRGKEGQNHVGNSMYRNLVDVNREAYVKSDFKQKRKIAASIVDAIHEEGGRFLKMDTKGGKWVEISEKQAFNKVTQALREGQSKIRQRLGMVVRDISERTFFRSSSITNDNSSNTFKGNFFDEQQNQKEGIISNVSDRNIAQKHLNDQPSMRLDHTTTLQSTSKYVHNLSGDSPEMMDDRLFLKNLQNSHFTDEKQNVHQKQSIVPTERGRRRSSTHMIFDTINENSKDILDAARPVLAHASVPRRSILNRFISTEGYTVTEPKDQFMSDTIYPGDIINRRESDTSTCLNTEALDGIRTSITSIMSIDTMGTFTCSLISNSSGSSSGLMGSLMSTSLPFKDDTIVGLNSNPDPLLHVSVGDFSQPNTPSRRRSSILFDDMSDLHSSRRSGGRTSMRLSVLMQNIMGVSEFESEDSESTLTVKNF
mmetsp:Transcript_8819/g.12534  ORF Transcript_8819/g.12534 Transcript_8819/m.12534 type:complete len:439 (+) Transcript_8819:111-1427(+)